MDLAYDHIQEEALAPEKRLDKEANQPETTLNSDFQEAYKAISSSPWGTRLGGFLGSIVKQSGEVYKEAQKELTEVGEDATKGFTDLRSALIKRTKDLSILQSSSSAGEGTTRSDVEDTSTDNAQTQTESVLVRLRSEAAKRLKEIEKAEDAADEALLKFGTNIRNFLRDAITVAPPLESSDGKPGSVVFESKDASGKRVIHTTRFDAQLYVIHTSPENFTTDLVSEEYELWVKDFNVDSMTEAISKDLELYTELRALMEKLVPDAVPYTNFWTRYYFLKHSIETAEARRRNLLIGAVASEEEILWDEDSDDEKGTDIQANDEHISNASSRTLQPEIKSNKPPKLLNPEECRKSQDDKSLADSDESYDVVGAVSGSPSCAPSSPGGVRKNEESDEEDWE
ncbi:hypothetical protein K3495_g2142 [Podosphaera aphanis]|nr:hypothetical protein K3495_g2142 [Podosphaera aphanis]